MKKNRGVLFFILFFFFSTFCFPKDRPSVALVLGGGGAKGFAELPVLEMLEKIDIPIDMIIGTSFGSIIGGMYSAGYTVNEIYNLIKSVEWSSLFNDYEVSPYEEIVGERSLYNNLINITFGLDMSLKLGKGLSNGHNVYQLLKNYMLKYTSDVDFDSLPIPFRTVTTDMLNGEAVIFDKGDLAEAIRASMSIPGVFEPCEIDGHYYLDGGLRYNLPINIAKEYGYDIIIAIDISQQIRDNPEVYDSNPAVAILNTITIAQETTTKSMLKDATIVISPDMSNFSTFDFKKIDDIYKEGEIAANEAIIKLEEIRRSIYPEDYDSNGKRISEYKKCSEVGTYHQLENFVPDNLKIIGAYEQDELFIKNSFNKINRKEINDENFSMFLNDIYSTGNYKSILPRIYCEENHTTIELILSKKEIKEAKISLNTKIEQTASSSASTVANLTADIQLRGLTGIGSLISLRATSITDYGISMFYFQPFNPYLFLQFESNYYQDRYATISKLSLNTSNYKSFTTWKNSLAFGLRTNNGNLIKIGTFVNTNSTTWQNLLYDPYLKSYKNNLDNISLQDKVKGQDFGFFVDYSLDLQDRKTFAHSGVYVNLYSKILFPFNSKELFDPSLISSVDFKSSIPIKNKFSINPSFFVGTDFLQNLSKNINILSSEAFTNYDRFYFPQIATRTRNGTNKVTASLSMQFEPWDKVTILGGDVFFRFDFSVGNVTYGWDNLIPIDEEYINNYPILWNSSLGAVLKLKEGINVLLRFGVGATDEKYFTPFLALDIGSFRF